MMMHDIILFSSIKFVGVLVFVLFLSNGNFA